MVKWNLFLEKEPRKNRHFIYVDSQRKLSLGIWNTIVEYDEGGEERDFYLLNGKEIKAQTVRDYCLIVYWFYFPFNGLGNFAPIVPCSGFYTNRVGNDVEIVTVEDRQEIGDKWLKRYNKRLEQEKEANKGAGS